MYGNEFVLKDKNGKIKTIFIVGPTASGKTEISVSLAKRFGGEIISADSMQVYKGISIAAAVPNIEERGGIPHYLMEIKRPDEPYSVYDFVNGAKQKIKEINGRSGVPFVVGGTGLYIDSLAQNIDFGADGDSKIRDMLLNEADEKGIQHLYDKLADIDGETAARISQNDKKRIIRALEIYYSSGETMSDRIKKSKMKDGFILPFFIGLNFKDRQKLYDRIDSRVNAMMQNGLLEEARGALLNNTGKAAAQAIGHKELLPYINGEVPLEEAVLNLKRQTRRYAKRQLTWFRKNTDINWIYMDEPGARDRVFELCSDFLNS